VERDSVLAPRVSTEPKPAGAVRPRVGRCAEEEEMYCDQCGQPLSDQSTRCPACDTADPAISPPLRFPTPTSALVADPYQPLPGLAPLMPVDDPGFQPEERSGLSPSQIRGVAAAHLPGTR
jgi:hypothetical protein